MDATRPQTPENRVTEDELEQVATPVGYTAPSHALREGEMIWRTPDGPSLSENYPTSTDVRMRLPRYQPLMPPVVMSPTQDGRLLMAHPQDRLQSEIEDLKAQYQLGDQRVSQKQSKLFLGLSVLAQTHLGCGICLDHARRVYRYHRCLRYLHLSVTVGA
ncbi:hypothetical protein FPCIR_11553 [Fusarium pseudocircinatum]|uniref:Uncharacterized protein n=1 Tax=Fusarium pseudocircinatum TaxID=56676 RepID=A0A8H5NTU5_9HYPO|nr:hypothetical protein FPCIR_11553 [Fusarium pseudocircinatum]